MTFVTVDSKLTIDNDFLVIRKVKHEPTNQYWNHSFILFAFIIAYELDRVIDGNPKPGLNELVGLVFGFVFIYPHLKRIFNKLFIYQWGNKIKLNKIKEYVILPFDNELETTLRIQLDTGRQKLFIFRNAENQLNDFVEALKQNGNQNKSAICQ